MLKTVSTKIAAIDFTFRNSPAKIIANRNSAEIKLAGLTISSFEEGNEYEVQYWIARELVKARIARFREEVLLDSSKLYKIQWTEQIQTTHQISKLPANFYPKLRRYLKNQKEEVTKKPQRAREYEKDCNLTQDIINSRLKKIMSLASAPAQTRQALENLTEEEAFLYKRIYTLISEWRAQILKTGGKD